ncbi:MAG: hypothetical protein K0V04_33070 [Deltaproteobacteria bacterium]|nr:hypothetical protein [Deltaproteobacteria bacterium]
MTIRVSARGQGPSRLALAVFALVFAASAAGCGEDEVAETQTRGMPPGVKKKAEEKAKRRAGGGKASRRTSATAVEPEEDAEPLPDRPLPQLDGTSFARRRDPFQGFIATEPVQAEPDPIRADRAVKLRQYSFDDLRLVVIANSRRRGVRPQALFVAGDGISGTVMQGDFFSSAEVLLAAVNQGYVEIEVVDEELAATLGMKRGERRALYLNQD